MRGQVLRHLAGVMHRYDIEPLLRVPRSIACVIRGTTNQHMLAQRSKHVHVDHMDVTEVTFDGSRTRINNPRTKFQPHLTSTRSHASRRSTYEQQPYCSRVYRSWSRCHFQVTKSGRIDHRGPFAPHRLPQSESWAFFRGRFCMSSANLRFMDWVASWTF